MNLKMLIMMLDTSMASIENEIIGIIFIFISITISCIFNWKQIQLESMKYQLSS